MDERYSRQMLFKPIGIEGQQLLRNARVAIIGCGALGSAIAETLVRAGVDQLHLVDRDIVEYSNLQRQQLFTESHAEQRMPKVIAAKQRLLEIRSDLKLKVTIDHADSMLLEELAQNNELIMDATDNFETRLMINDAAYKYGVTWIYGACVGSSGVVFPFVPKQSACFRCLLPQLPSLNQTCDTNGIIAPAVQITAALQCTEALKWLTNNRDTMIKKLHHFDLWNHERLNVGISRIKRNDCLTCGNTPVYPDLSAQGQTKIAMLCGRDTVQIMPDHKRYITLEAAERAGRNASAVIRRTPYFVELNLDQAQRIMIFNNGRILIHNVNNIHQARKLYHQLFG